MYMHTHTHTHTLAHTHEHTKQHLHTHVGREIVKRIDMWGIDMLFVVGGNGGNAGANAIQVCCVLMLQG